MDEEVQEATRDLLNQKPELREALVQLVNKDTEGPWSFQEIDIDSGAFGEIVASGIVEEIGDGYQLTDPQAVESVLSGSVDKGGSSLRLRKCVPNVNPRGTGAIVAVIAVVVFVRVFVVFPAVFRDGIVVLTGNDPYMYHHIVERLVSSDLPAFDISSLSRLSVDFLQFEVRTHDTLLIVVLWWLSAAIGDDPSTVSIVLAWYPVIAASFTGICTYLLTKQLTDDVRCSLAAVLFLAITPAHAFRTALGFSDHHAFDYVWLGFTALALLWVVNERIQFDDHKFGISNRGWLGIAAGGVGITAQTSAWRGGPLLLVPIALYAVGKMYFHLQNGTSAVLNTVPLLMMLTVGAGLSLTSHFAFDWHTPARAFAPFGLLVGATTLVLFTSTLQYLKLSTEKSFLSGLMIGLIIAVGIPIVVSPIGDAIVRLIAYFQGYSGSGIAETRSLFSGQLGSIAAPIIFFGFGLFVALPFKIWATWTKVVKEKESKWLVIVAYAWWLFVLSVIQNRFTGELAIFAAIFTGIGFVFVAAWVDIVQSPSLFSKSDAGQVNNLVSAADIRNVFDLELIASLFFIFLLIGGIGIVQSSIKMQQVTVSDAEFETGRWLAEYADDQGIPSSDTYVLSEWGSNRADNYLVNGDTESYDYARANYAEFLSATAREGWYDQFSSDNVRFIVTRQHPEFPENSIYTQLREEYGSATAQQPALSHYRVLYISGGGSLMAFEVVPGATIQGTAASNETFRLKTNLSILGGGREDDYEKQLQTGKDGNFRATVPYAGTYTVNNRTINVPEDAVRNGTTVSVR